MKKIILVIPLIGILLMISTANFPLPTNAEAAFKTYLPLILTPSGTPPPNTCPALPSPWLEVVNYYREAADLPSVTENSLWSDGDRKHSRYMVKNNFIGHTEDPTKSFYTPEGALAAEKSNVMASSSATETDQQAVNLWMEGPFHALGIIDPALAQVGFGSYRESDGGYQMAAALDVIRGLGSIPAGTTFPILFPKDQGCTPLLEFTGSETPDPLTSCSGYTAPTGPPIMIQIGAGGGLSPTVSASSVKENGLAREHCTFHKSNYVNSKAADQTLGRAILDMRDAVVLLPRLRVWSAAFELT
jgi:hypothetical protein